MSQSDDSSDNVMLMMLAAYVFMNTRKPKIKDVTRYKTLQQHNTRIMSVTQILNNLLHDAIELSGKIHSSFQIFLRLSFRYWLFLSKGKHSW